MQTKCYKCGTALEFAEDSILSRSEECPKCFANLRSCKMCHFYDINAYNECKEPTADRILDKEKANFCDHFRVGDGHDYNDVKSDALSQANALFKK